VKCALPALSIRRNTRPDRSLTKLRARLVAKDSLTETTLPLTSKVVLVCPSWNQELPERAEALHPQCCRATVRFTGACW
jgi:hypothetical protein